MAIMLSLGMGAGWGWGGTIGSSLFCEFESSLGQEFKPFLEICSFRGSATTAQGLAVNRL